MRRSRMIWLATLVLASATAAGCARRAHTRSDFGVANKTFFDRQAQATGSGSALQGLDSDEASSINQQYRQSRGTRGAGSRNDPGSSVLILQEGRRDEANRRP